jgi:catechol 2,3-dioxygenase-like lactoylglutathione lyase family enzyme
MLVAEDRRKAGEMPKINGLVESALFVEKLPRARDFYLRVLGLEIIQESDVGCVFMVAKGQLLLLVSVEKATVPSKTPGGEVPACLDRNTASLGAGHIAFGVAEADVDGWRNCLNRNGVEVLSEVVWERGAHSLYFRDPDGHLIELATPGLWGLDW